MSGPLSSEESTTLLNLLHRSINPKSPPATHAALKRIVSEVESKTVEKKKKDVLVVPLMRLLVYRKRKNDMQLHHRISNALQRDKDVNLRMKSTRLLDAEQAKQLKLRGKNITSGRNIRVGFGRHNHTLKKVLATLMVCLQLRRRVHPKSGYNAFTELVSPRPGEMPFTTCRFMGSLLYTYLNCCMIFL